MALIQLGQSFWVVLRFLLAFLILADVKVTDASELEQSDPTEDAVQTIVSEYKAVCLNTSSHLDTIIKTAKSRGLVRLTISEKDIEQAPEGQKLMLAMARSGSVWFWLGRSGDYQFTLMHAGPLGDGNHPTPCSFMLDATPLPHGSVIQFFGQDYRLENVFEGDSTFYRGFKKNVVRLHRDGQKQEINLIYNNSSTGTPEVVLILHRPER